MSLCFLVLSRCVEQGFAQFEYILYICLAGLAKLTAMMGDKHMIIAAQGTLVVKGLDHTNETSITLMTWSEASNVAVERTRTHWGEKQASNLSSHHAIVLKIAYVYTWTTAMLYDIQQREALALDPTHDLSTIDATAVSLISAKVGLQSLAVQQTQFAQSGGSQVSPNKRSAAHFQTKVECQPKRVASRTFPSPTGGMPTCFWCGKSGHFPKDCSVTVTKAGCTPATLSTTSRSPNGLISTSGSTFCFQFASTTCHRGAACNFLHACSVCGDKNHGAQCCTASH